MGDAPKSAYEIAMEKLRQRDRERGEAAPATLTKEQKAAIAEIRSIYEARLAEREILFRSERARAAARLAEDPEALAKAEAEYARDRRKLEEERDTKVASAHAAAAAPPQAPGGGSQEGKGRGGRGGARRGGGRGGGGRSGTQAGLLLAVVTLGILAAAWGAAAPPATAAPATTPAAPPIAIRAARLLDGTDSPERRDVMVVVQGDTILSVEAARGGTAPAGATLLDLGEATLLPGLIDAHTHVLLQGDATERDYTDQILKESVPHRTVRAVAAARIALLNGFTTLRDLGTEGAGYSDVALRDGILEGYVPGPRLYVATLALDVSGAYPVQGFDLASPVPSGVQVVDGPDAGRAAVREQIRHGADWIKVYCDRGYFIGADGGLDSIPTFDGEELAAIVDEAHRRGRRVAAHAMAPKGIRNALDAGVDTIEHGVAIDAESIRRMAAKGTFYCPTVTAMQDVAPDRAAEGRSVWSRMPDIQRRSFEAALRGGVRIAFGTDAGGFPWSVNQAEEFVWLVKYGMAPAQAIRSATGVGAALLGREKEIGRVAPGFRADLVAVPGNPLADIGVLKRVGFVMQAGKVVKNEFPGPAPSVKP
ncbi:MAG: amidohydrolase [Acidobacteria bacterium]|nr:MAG: amidohydrolase [Acidobacteriota bacterium]